MPHSDKKIICLRPDGGVSVITPADNCPLTFEEIVKTKLTEVSRQMNGLGNFSSKFDIISRKSLDEESNEVTIPFTGSNNSLEILLAKW